MEFDNAEYTEGPGTEETSLDGYTEDTADADSGADTEEGTKKSEDNVDDSFDDTGSNTNDGTASSTEIDSAALDGALSDGTGNTVDDDNGEINSGDLLESLDALIKALSPDSESETGETEGTGTEESPVETEISEYDSQTLETLHGIQSTLAAIQAENELWHTETLRYREETRETQESVIVHLEYASLLLMAIGFFVAFLCGGKFADIFFKRMKGDGRNE